MTYSIDFRKKVLFVKDKEELTIEEAARRFDIGVASVVRWSNRLEPCLTRNKPATKINSEALAKDVELYPDDYQYERAARFNASQRGIGDALKRLKISHKKSLKHPKADPEKRQRFEDKIESYEAENRPLIYIDESGFAHDMPRTHGYASVGERCFGKQDWQAKGRTNVIGALFASCLLTVSLFTGSINADVFLAWTEQDLLPKLPPNCVIVMDNATFHKRTDIQKMIQDAGHTLEYLPPYSPDLNPIEHKWAQSKAIRKQKHCSVDELFSQPLF